MSSPRSTPSPIWTGGADRIPVRLDPAEWPGFPEAVVLDVAARAHRITVDGIDIVLLSGDLFDNPPDSLCLPRELNGHSLDFLKPRVVQALAARYVRERTSAGTVVRLHEPFYQFLLPGPLAGHSLNVVATV
ncbi:hypothetical protein [Streptomyces sp. NRRL B-3229]|uniref:hypothetical protein n=1 Tax=Streptomyces sp. NRRL B-3229 TaxID=1463836 RepID=UPI0004BEAADA|nr:hypothetical protein [Streptomyces sp. NRRL B-3229]